MMSDKLREVNSETQILQIKMPQELLKRVNTHCEKISIVVDEFILDAIAEKLELAYKERRRKHRL
jgi:hypothetical protein